MILLIMTNILSGGNNCKRIHIIYIPKMRHVDPYNQNEEDGNALLPRME